MITRFFNIFNIIIYNPLLITLQLIPGLYYKHYTIFLFLNIRQLHVKLCSNFSYHNVTTNAIIKVQTKLFIFNTKSANNSTQLPRFTICITQMQ